MEQDDQNLCSQSSILIVEDNPFNQQTLLMMIKGAYKNIANPDTASDGIEGL